MAVHASRYRLSELVGSAVALQLIDRFGGSSIYLPNPGNVNPNSELALVLGVENVRKLSVEWPQLQVTLPSASGLERTRRDRAIVRDRRTLSIAKLARKYRLTERGIYLILRRQRAAP